MTDLILKGELNLAGNLKLAGDGGKVKVGTNEVLVEVGRNSLVSQGAGIPVILPLPPGTPIDNGTEVKVFNSFNSNVTVKVKGDDIAVVAQGICIQGSKPLGTWPGMVLPSTINKTVTINRIQINVDGDSGITLPNGGTVQFSASGQ